MTDNAAKSALLEKLSFEDALKELEGRTELLEVAKEDELELAEPAGAAGGMEGKPVWP